MWTLPEMDFVMVHSYSRHNGSDLADNSQFETVSTSQQFGKPTYVAETGENGRSTDKNGPAFPADPTGIGLHNALWASMTSMGAMCSAVWWWDNWVAPERLYHHFTPARMFADSVAWPSFVWKPIGHNGNRHFTFLIYLNHVEGGGETSFPRLNITITPKAYLSLIHI